MKPNLCIVYFISAIVVSSGFPFNSVRCEIEHMLCEASRLPAARERALGNLTLALRLTKTCKVQRQNDTASLSSVSSSANVLEQLEASSDIKVTKGWKIEGGSWGTLGLENSKFSVDSTSGWVVLREDDVAIPTAERLTLQKLQLPSSPRSDGIAGYLKGAKMCGSLVFVP